MHVDLEDFIALIAFKIKPSPLKVSLSSINPNILYILDMDEASNVVCGCSFDLNKCEISNIGEQWRKWLNEFLEADETIFKYLEKEMVLTKT